MYFAVWANNAADFIVGAMNCESAMHGTPVSALSGWITLCREHGLGLESIFFNTQLLRQFTNNSDCWGVISDVAVKLLQLRRSWNHVWGLPFDCGLAGIHNLLSVGVAGRLVVLVEEAESVEACFHCWVSQYPTEKGSTQADTLDAPTSASWSIVFIWSMILQPTIPCMPLGLSFFWGFGQAKQRDSTYFHCGWIQKSLVNDSTNLPPSYDCVMPLASWFISTKKVGAIPPKQNGRCYTAQ